MEEKDIAYHQRVYAGYLDMAAREPERWVVVDACRDIQAVQADICAAIEERFGLQEEGRMG
jgi:dTMP kinase